MDFHDFGQNKKSAPSFRGAMILIWVNRLLKSQIDQALVADFDGFHGV